MTQEQFLSFVRTSLGLLGGIAATYGGVTSSAWAMVTGVVLAVAPYVWGWFSHTNAATILAASQVPGVQAVQVAPDADDSLKKLAADTSPETRKVVAAPTSQPSSTVSSSQRR